MAKCGRVILWVALAGVAVCLPVRGDDQPQFSSPEARSAKSAYEAAASLPGSPRILEMTVDLWLICLRGDSNPNRIVRVR